jgi:hypothetical protein
MCAHVLLLLQNRERLDTKALGHHIFKVSSFIILEAYLWRREHSSFVPPSPALAEPTVNKPTV